MREGIRLDDPPCFSFFLLPLLVLEMKYPSFSLPCLKFTPLTVCVTGLHLPVLVALKDPLLTLLPICVTDDTLSLSPSLSLLIDVRHRSRKEGQKSQ